MNVKTGVPLIFQGLYGFSPDLIRVLMIERL